MKKFILPISVLCFFVSSCGKPDTIDPLPGDNTIPSLITSFVSTASTLYFTPFGADLQGGGGISKGYEITLADTNSDVVASTKAYITSVNMIAADNYEIHSEIKHNSIYDVIYTNVAYVTLVAGDSVNQGTLLGKVGANGKAGFRVERKDTHKAICPSTLGSTSFNTPINQALIQHNSFNADTLTIPCRASELDL